MTPTAAASSSTAPTKRSAPVGAGRLVVDGDVRVLGVDGGEYETLQWLTVDELAARRRELVREWNRLSHAAGRNAPDPVEADRIDRTLQIIARIQRERSEERA
jgi:hypothetical protein